MRITFKTSTFIFTMKPFFQFASAAALALLGSACSTPPREAWSDIQSRGLITYYVKGPQTQAQPPLGGQAKPTLLATTKPAGKSNEIVTVYQRQPIFTPRVTNFQLPVARSVNNLPGYVKSPYTTPGRLVDVRGVVPGSRVYCPYTRKPFLLPEIAPQRQLASTQISPDQMPKKRPAAAPIVSSAPAKIVRTPSRKAQSVSSLSNNPVRERPKKAAPQVLDTPPAAPQREVVTTEIKNSPPTVPTQPVVQPAPANKPVVEAAPPVMKVTTPAAPKRELAAPRLGASSKVDEAPTRAAEPKKELLYGKSVPNRPGFVNSPFAGKNQLVDVTGLPAGMEVKCPYTGKLFKVPAQR
jgi:hypothetical protein